MDESSGTRWRGMTVFVLGFLVALAGLHGGTSLALNSVRIDHGIAMALVTCDALHARI